jgi:hypothetical protein
MNSKVSFLSINGIDRKSMRMVMFNFEVREGISQRDCIHITFEKCRSMGVIPTAVTLVANNKPIVVFNNWRVVNSIIKVDHMVKTKDFLEVSHRPISAL